MITSGRLFPYGREDILRYMRRFLLVFISLCIILVPHIGSGEASALSQADPAADLLENMTPEERVGQLFLVTFEGRKIEVDDPIYKLIVDNHVSGVLLEKNNNNFGEGPDALRDIRNLISTLQDIETSGSNDPASPNVYIPLLIATRYESGWPYSEILSGLSELPDQMAIGATWNTDYAYQVGNVIGRELDVLGFNLLIGPSLDVLEEPRLVKEGDLGVRTFGGDPYWVGQLGRAYTSGVHDGSNNGMSVVVKHFPGLGSADRPIEEEVATVRKSLEQLKQIELAPFFSVTGAAPGSNSEIADGLLVSHIRYQGFQGNVRATTRPISLDPQAYSQLMALEPLAVWRDAGGVTVSDSLGTRAIRRFRDPTERTFKSHLVARDAFLAGNDLLILSDFKNPEDVDELTTIQFTLEFFAQKYREDSSFAQLVDNAVLRILNLKLRMFGEDFRRARVYPPSFLPGDLGENSDITAQVAISASTLVSPSQDEVIQRLGGAPQLGERILFFTDVRMVRQCSTCEDQQWMNVRGLEQTVLSLYGPAAAGEVGSWNLNSYSMADLAYFLGAPVDGVVETALAPPEELEQLLISADWLVFSVLDGSEDVYGSNALKLLLDQRPDLARNKQLVVFAHDIPYGLDATDISKVDVYYALYGSSPIFIDVAAHLLFLEQSAPGASPVSIPGIGYDLIDATSPDPEQVITLQRIGAAPSETGGENTEEENTELSIGDVVTVRTGRIIDTNGHHVPDGTVVEFSITQQSENITSTAVDATTQMGYAEISITLERLGLMTISARSDPARTSETLQINIQEGAPIEETIVTPTQVPTFDSATEDATQSPTPSATLTSGGNGAGTEKDVITFSHFLFGMLGVLFSGGYAYASANRNEMTEKMKLRCAIIPIIGSLIGYNYIALGFPGSNVLLNSLGIFAGLMMTIIWGLICVVAVKIWCLEFINST
jgi:beta-N-acetylhexosaminidase